MEGGDQCVSVLTLLFNITNIFLSPFYVTFVAMKYLQFELFG